MGKRKKQSQHRTPPLSLRAAASSICETRPSICAQDKPYSPPCDPSPLMGTTTRCSRFQFASLSFKQGKRKRKIRRAVARHLHKCRQGIRPWQISQGPLVMRCHPVVEWEGRNTYCSVGFPAVSFIVRGGESSNLGLVCFCTDTTMVQGTLENLSCQ